LGSGLRSASPRCASADFVGLLAAHRGIVARVGEQRRSFQGRARPARHGTSEHLTGLNPIREALAARRRELRRLDVRAGATHPGLALLAEQARRIGVHVRELADRDADRLAAPGVELEAGPLPELGLEELIGASPEGADPRTLVALDGVEDPQNLGAIARVAESAGALGLVLTHRHAPPLSAAVSRASAGAIEWLPVARVPNLARALELLQGEGFWVLGADAEAADSLYDLPERLARADRVVVFGAEGRGLRPGVARRLDQRLRIPLRGKVDSLNVSTAASVVLFELERRSARS
jgi:23S rRNA (guanosine2251-2'-O)-methyltransferase